MIDLQIRSAVSNRVTFLESMVRPAISMDAGFWGEDSLLTDRTRFSQSLKNFLETSVNRRRYPVPPPVWMSYLVSDIPEAHA